MLYALLILAVPTAFFVGIFFEKKNSVKIQKSLDDAKALIQSLRSQKPS
jgi:hypothetical protein